MQHWTTYWQNTKTLNSFAEGNQGLGYSGDIADFWRKIFETVGSHSSLLDIATGNGGLAVLALQLNETFQISAVDKADIQPLSLFNSKDDIFYLLQKINFYGNMPAENLIFNNETFDLVISQFGFEYTDLFPTIKQIHRVLKSNGKFVAMVHHTDSFISQDCRIGLKVLQLFLKDKGLMAKATDFANYCQILQKTPVLSESQLTQLRQKSALLLQSFKDTQNNLNDVERDWFNQVAKELVPFLANWRELTVEIVHNKSLSLHYFRERITEQLTVAWDNNNVKMLEAFCNKQGFKTSISTFELPEGKLCWVCDLMKIHV
ncbi:class I SAM-dependent methyltransferase [Rheinheimera sp. UJ63]|uniref:class I SAM-dependent methyltransferase n=1 Tax=Rheinheimera sp. UJ63 TaxID=2910157 RepID=UPI001F1A2B31|nr:class I SAM-dependent methyltransferase [Rheinheimera sp. UJ63]MCF4008058.1 class I SAM-dependent methyltransferase [Rheinheimera sp. UJ63]